jgi:2-polyprenyl-3-methyl-5-hydroxy-6-metoxy-1,4-benzoquinol methylase
MRSARVANDMRRPFYAGATLHVRSYDSINRSDRPVLRGDISFYLDLARRAGRDVLEVGVETGRVAIKLAKSRIQVTGLDLSADMLAIAAEKATTSGLTQGLRLAPSSPSSNGPGSCGGSSRRSSRS